MEKIDELSNKSTGTGNGCREASIKEKRKGKENDAREKKLTIEDHDVAQLILTPLSLLIHVFCTGLDCLLDTLPLHPSLVMVVWIL